MTATTRSNGDEMKRSDHIARRTGSSKWQYREAVPKELQDLLRAVGKKPKAEVWRSLHTSDLDEARRRVAQVRADQLRMWDQEIASLKASQRATPLGFERVPARAAPDMPLRIPTPDELKHVAYQFGYDLLTQAHDKRRKELAGRPEAEWDAYVDSLADAIQQDGKRLAQGEFSRWHGSMTRIAERQGWLMDERGAEYALGCEYLAKAAQDARRVLLERAKGNLDAKPTSDLVLSAIARDKMRASKGRRLLDLYDTYAVARSREGKNRSDTLTQGRKMVQVFAEFVGIDRDPETIAPEEVAEFRDILATLPGSFRKRNDFAGKSLREAKKFAAELGLKPMTLANVNKYLSSISPLFTWAKRNRKISTANPFTGLHFEVGELANERRPFLPEELTKIFGSPLFTGFAGDGREHVAGHQMADDWRYWIPLVCLFTGSRIGEVAQLHVGDLSCDHGIWYFNILEDEDTGRRTKNRSPRVVPVHQSLLDLGIIRFHAVQQRRSAVDGNPALFVGLTPDKRGFLGAEPSRFWRRYLARIGIKDGADGLGAHTFRHTIADELRAADFKDDEFGPLILGHAKSSVTGKYGRISEGTLRTRNEMIQSVAFKGVDLNPLFEASAAREGALHAAAFNTR